MAQDVWGAGASEAVPKSEGEGIGANRAFAIDTVFGLGYALMREQPALVLVAGGVMVGGQVLAQAVSQASSLAGAADPMIQIAGSLVSIVVSLMSALVILWITAGLMGQVERVARDEEVELAGLFSAPTGVSVLVGNILAQLMVTLPVILVISPSLAVFGWQFVAIFEGAEPNAPVLLVASLWFVAALLGVSWFALFTSLVTPAAVFGEEGPIAAIGAAWRAADGARLTLFVLLLGFGFGQLLMCCLGVVGLVPFMGIYQAGLAMGWLLYARPAAVTKAWPFIQRNGLHLY